MANHVNLCDDEIENNSEIASEENNEDNEEESANILVCKPNMKSVVWFYFSIKAGEDGVPLRDKMDKPICTLCKKSFRRNALTQPIYSNICKNIMPKSIQK